ncbi:E3 ubiquitin-protein ligase MARCH2 [Octopus vulgaris]|uniref:E3 ubiquitin-protein ligase MARCH2 n=1 Tax=Octopus vulgaris TaxID=6645 RepID=A0AA36EZ49_OCTVU|nr:E3 ubiquitin-protein ligase MARCH2 [Octopus vulgaris]
MAAKGSTEKVPINNRLTNSCGQAKAADQYTACSSTPENEEPKDNDCEQFQPALIKSESLNNGQITSPKNRYQLLTESKKSPPLQWRPTLQRAETIDSTPKSSLSELHSQKRNYAENYPRHQNGSTRMRANSISTGRIRHQWNQVSLVRSQTISTSRSPLNLPAWNLVPEYARPKPFPAARIGTQRILSTNQPLPNAGPQNICPENCKLPVVRHSLSVQSTPLNATRLIHTASTPCATAFSDSTMNFAGNQKWRIKHISYPSPDYSMLHKKNLENGSLVDQADNVSDVSDDVNSSSDASICRICHEGESTAKLISPCYCTGSMGKLHVTCLERWLGSSYMNRCEICGYEYIVLRQPKPFIEFLKNPDMNMKPTYHYCKRLFNIRLVSGVVGVGVVVVVVVVVVIDNVRFPFISTISCFSFLFYIITPFYSQSQICYFTYDTDVAFVVSFAVITMLFVVDVVVVGGGGGVGVEVDAVYYKSFSFY